MSGSGCLQVQFMGSKRLAVAGLDEAAMNLLSCADVRLCGHMVASYLASMITALMTIRYP